MSVAAVSIPLAGVGVRPPLRGGLPLLPRRRLLAVFAARLLAARLLPAWRIHARLLSARRLHSRLLHAWSLCPGLFPRHLRARLRTILGARTLDVALARTASLTLLELTGHGFPHRILCALWPLLVLWILGFTHFAWWALALQALLATALQCLGAALMLLARLALGLANALGQRTLLGWREPCSG